MAETNAAELAPAGASTAEALVAAMAGEPTSLEPITPTPTPAPAEAASAAPVAQSDAAAPMVRIGDRELSQDEVVGLVYAQRSQIDELNEAAQPGLILQGIAREYGPQAVQYLVDMTERLIDHIQSTGQIPQMPATGLPVIGEQNVVFPGMPRNVDVVPVEWDSVGDDVRNVFLVAKGLEQRVKQLYGLVQEMRPIVDAHLESEQDRKTALALRTHGLSWTEEQVRQARSRYRVPHSGLMQMAADGALGNKVAAPARPPAPPEPGKNDSDNLFDDTVPGVSTADALRAKFVEGKKLVSELNA